VLDVETSIDTAAARTVTPEQVGEARAVVAELMAARTAEQARFEKIRRYLRGKHDSVYVPPKAATEFEWLVERAKVNLLPLIVDTPAQAMFVDGYRSIEATENMPAWEGWQANRMDARQTGLHRAALAYGTAYNLVLPGAPVPVWYPLSPRACTTAYEDVTQDEWPVYALIYKALRSHVEVTLVDDRALWRFAGKHPEEGQTVALEFQQVEYHDLGVCPVVRYVNRYDLDGEIVGEVEPIIPVQDQVNFTTFGLLMAQQYAAFRQRWVTGMAIPTDPSGNPVEPFNSAVNRLWVGEDPDTKFGEFGQTALDGYLASRDSSMRSMATMAQFPPHHLMGPMSNISGEALSAAEIQQTRMVTERKQLAGESHEQSFRLHALAAGDTAGWEDTTAQVIWRDVNNVNLGAVADAWGKIATQLKVPVEMLWEKIPGWTQADVERARAMTEAAAGDSMTQLIGALNEQTQALTAQQPAPEVPANGDKPA
jgi:hypothetical protein